MKRPRPPLDSVPEARFDAARNAVRRDHPVPDRIDTSIGDAQPPWLIAIRRRMVPGGAQHPVTGRRAAVLVVLVDNSEGPGVLLTRRSNRLRYLPDAITFPGGSLEVTDGGPVGAALREAAEEIALDPTSVDVLGQLPDRLTVEKEFVVTPVIAWTRHLHLTAAPSPHEVSGIGIVPLADLARLLSNDKVTMVCLPDANPERPGTTLAGPVAPMTAALLVEIAAACQI